MKGEKRAHYQKELNLYETCHDSYLEAARLVGIHSGVDGPLEGWPLAEAPVYARRPGTPPESSFFPPPFATMHMVGVCLGSSGRRKIIGEQSFPERRSGQMLAALPYQPPLGAATDSFPTSPPGAPKCSFFSFINALSYREQA